jgi:type I restriction enzyme R subunit
VERTIRDAYLDLPKPAYTDELRKEKRVLTYAHIYDNYFGTGKSVFSVEAATPFVANKI